MKMFNVSGTNDLLDSTGESKRNKKIWCGGPGVTGPSVMPTSISTQPKEVHRHLKKAIDWCGKVKCNSQLFYLALN